jgi:YD repeat-containing protein
VTDNWTHDNFAEPTAYTASVAGTPVYSTTFTRDKLGRITSKTETSRGVTDNYVYGYDAAGRLETVTKSGTLISQYTYDANGNRLTRTTAEGIATYTTDNQDRLTTWNLAPDTWNLTYNPNGELQSKTNGSQTSTYQYDVVGNLRHVTLRMGTKSTTSSTPKTAALGRRSMVAWFKVGFMAIN